MRLNNWKLLAVVKQDECKWNSPLQDPAMGFHLDANVIMFYKASHASITGLNQTYSRYFRHINKICNMCLKIMTCKFQCCLAISNAFTSNIQISLHTGWLVTYFIIYSFLGVFIAVWTQSWPSPWLTDSANGAKGDTTRQHVFSWDGPRRRRRRWVVCNESCMNFLHGCHSTIFTLHDSIAFDI